MRKLLLGFALFALPLFSVAGVSAINYEQEKNIKISPIVECIVDNGDSYTVYWGYENKSTLNGQPYNAPSAEANQKFTGGSADLPSEFVYPNVYENRPGRTAFDQAEPNAFTTELVSGNQVWTLNGRTATASPNTKACPAFFEFDKVWAGDEIDEEAVMVEFIADDEFSWVFGQDAPVMVTPGKTTLTGVEEVVTGLPEGCDYVTDLPKEVSAPTHGYDDRNVFTLQVTNTVTCEDEEEVVEEDGQVLANVDEEVDVVENAQVTVVPAGAADAGGAAFAAYGLVTSGVLAGASVAAKKYLV